MPDVSQRGAPLDVRLRIDLGPQSSIGPGKIALLEHIEASGSLSQAARDLGMSYRRAWLLLDDLNHALPEPVTTASIGGAGGGGAALTPFGRKLVAAYRDVEHASHDVAAERLAWLARGASLPRGGRGAAKAAERRPVSRSLTKHSAPRGRS
ncbi:MAG: winged helix-turn-helix domain-containing protein [Steroidobacteraceae bacterium]